MSISSLMPKYCKLKRLVSVTFLKRNFSKNGDEFKVDAYNSLSTLKWSALKMRMEGASEIKGPITNFGGISKSMDDSNSKLNQQSSPLGKLMEDRVNTNPENNNFMVALDPNTSMWQQFDSNEKNISPEKREEICSSILVFYKKRCETEQKRLETIAEKTEQKPNVTKSSLYRQIAKRSTNQRQGSMGLMHNTYTVRELEDEEPTNERARMQNEQRPNPFERPLEFTGGQNLYQNNVRKSQGNDAPNFSRNAFRQMQDGNDRIDGRFQSRPKQQERRFSESTKRDDQHGPRDGMMEYAIYDDTTPRANPIFSSTRADDGQGDKVSGWRSRSNDNQSKKSGKPEENKGQYSPVSVDSMFKPSGYATSRMKVMPENPHMNHLNRPFQYI